MGHFFTPVCASIVLCSIGNSGTESPETEKQRRHEETACAGPRPQVGLGSGCCILADVRVARDRLPCFYCRSMLCTLIDAGTGVHVCSEGGQDTQDTGHA